MPRPPFRMRSNRTATLICNGRFVTGGRASYVWETFLLRRAAGVPGQYAIRAERDRPWHRLDWTIDEAEDALAGWGRFGHRHVARMQKLRQSRAERGLPVA